MPDISEFDAIRTAEAQAAAKELSDVHNELASVHVEMEKILAENAQLKAKLQTLVEASKSMLCVYYKTNVNYRSGWERGVARKLTGAILDTES